MAEAQLDPTRSEVDALFRLHAVGIGRFLAQMVRDRSLAEDLLQETFLTAVREGTNLEQIENRKAWLFGIARNRALGAMRSRRRALRALQKLIAEPRRAEDDPADVESARELLDQLSPDDRALLVLRYLHGFAATELAEMSGQSGDAVRQRLGRARQRLVALLDSREPAPSPDQVES